MKMSTWKRIWKSILICTGLTAFALGNAISCGGTPQGTTVEASAEGKEIGVEKYQVTGTSAEGLTLVGMGKDGKEVSKVFIKVMEDGQIQYDFNYGTQSLKVMTKIDVVDGKTVYSGTLNGEAYNVEAKSDKKEDIQKTGKIPLDEQGVKAWNSWGPMFGTLLPKTSIKDSSCTKCILTAGLAVIGAISCVGIFFCGAAAVGVVVAAQDLKDGGCLKKNNPCSLSPTSGNTKS